MDKRNDLRIRKGDILLIAAVLLLAAALFIPIHSRSAGEAAVVQVWQEGELVREIPIWSDVEFTVEGSFTNTVRIEGGKVAVVASDCPSQDCVRTGWRSRTGQSIICLPNQVEIRLVGQGSDPEVDAAAG